MRVYGLTSPVKSLGWLLGIICLGLALLYPPVPGLYQSFPDFSLSVSLPLERAFWDWHSNFSYVLATGGVVWQVIVYLHRQSFAGTIGNSRTLFSEFAPICFVPVTLTLSALILWRRVVDYAPRPTIVRGVLAVLFALLSSLLLVFLLDWVGGRALLYFVRISLTGNIEIRSLISVIWITSIVQTIVLALPCLAVGGLLAWRQGYLETRARSLRRNTRTARQELEE